MAKRPKMWVYSPPKPPKPKVPEAVKKHVETQAHEFVASGLKPKHLVPAPKDAHWNYLVDISTKWYRNYFYFCAKYCSPGPQAISPFFETPFARLEYVGEQEFHLSYMRHTGQWWELYTAVSVEECFAAIRDEPHFLP
jgi:hypothetical protein